MIKHIGFMYGNFNSFFSKFFSLAPTGFEGPHHILVGNANESKSTVNFKKPYFFIDLSNLAITPGSNLIYLIICLIKLQEVVVFSRKL